MLTVDTATNLAFLDLTVTFMANYNTVATQFGVGGAYEGFRFATIAEAQSLMSDAGLFVAQSTVFYSPTPAQVAAINFLTPLLGDTLSLTYGSNYYGSRGIVADPSIPGFRIVGGYLADNKTAAVNDYFGVGPAGYGGNGVWLVQDVAATNPTPEPASMGLLAMGGGLLAVGRKLRRRKTELAA